MKKYGFGPGSLSQLTPKGLSDGYCNDFPVKGVLKLHKLAKEHCTGTSDPSDTGMRN